LVAVAVGSLIGWGLRARNAKMSHLYTPHTIQLQVPHPLSDAEVGVLRDERRAALEAAGEPTMDELGEEIDVLADVDLPAIALARATARGKHLVSSRYFCGECHGKDFSGGVMIDASAMGRWFGPNLTGGQGSAVLDYDHNDWDNIVRHGVRKDGTAAVMPSDDFVGMSDQELADIIVYVQSFPSVDNETPKRTFGPVSTMLLATGNLNTAASRYADLDVHLTTPPESAETVEFGAHLAQTCTGCHRSGLNGGPIPGGDPAWAPATNLTPVEGGIVAGYGYDDFQKVMREGTKPDGNMVALPMSLLPQYTSTMTDTEVKALWAYIQALEAQPTGS
jgi:mono/diheme cytochrome c family protein